MKKDEVIHLISRWYLKLGMLEEAVPVLEKLASEVQAHEQSTLAYLVHYPKGDDEKLISLPLASEREVTFFEIYQNQQAFDEHVNGPIFTKFVTQYGYLFEQSEENVANNKPFHTVSFLDCKAGFFRPAISSCSTAGKRSV